MSEFNYKNIDILSLSLDGFEGPIDLLLSLARDHKIDLTKLSILKLSEQYLEFLDQIIKKDIDIAAEYLVCLLYTSPSPRDSCASRMPSSA